MTSWASKDPIDHCLRAMARGEGRRKRMGSVLLAVVGTYALCLLTLPLERLPLLDTLRLPLKAFHTLTQTKQDWAMFKEFPHAHFSLNIEVGTLSGRQWEGSNSLGPVIPGCENFDPAKQLRYYLFFRNTFTQGSPERLRNHYFNQLRGALQSWAATQNEATRPTHFVIHLEVTTLRHLSSIDPSTFPPEPETHQLGPLPIDTP